MADGTNGADTFNGTAIADLYNGLDGNDTIYGNSGNDTLNGDGGADVIYGGNDDDSIRGGLGNDSLYGDAGNDTLSGGEDDDYLGDYQGSNSLDGGAGRDYFEYVGYGSGVDTLTGGAGSDTFSLYYPFSNGYVADIVTDFATGTGGDVLRLDYLGLSMASGVNPFLGGYLRLVQVGTAVQLQGDQNGGGDNWRTLLVLENTVATAFTAANFQPGYSPTGAGAVLDGNDSANNIVGTVNADTINGLGGNDTIDGREGDDSIDGGAGNDNLDGGYGNDTILGGTGSDTIYGGQGNDSMVGGDGQDYFGSDDGNDTQRGGDGDDRLGDYQGSNVLDGGAGADYFEYVGYGSGVDTLSGGAGSDVFNLYYAFSSGYVADIVTDFTTGTGGDVIRLNALGLSGLASGANPFTTGFLRLVQVGGAVELQGDQNGGGNEWRTLLVLQNTTVGAFTGANFDPGYSPTGTGLVLTGSDGANGIVGTVDGDTISGLGGNDTIDGNAGDDLIDGGSGNDQISGGQGADTITAGIGRDTIYAGDGNDVIAGDDGSDYLYGEGGNDSLSGGLGEDTLDGGTGDDTLLGGDGDDYLADYQGANSVSGGAGADYFEYVGHNTGVDTLTGGAGIDTFNLYYPFSAGYAADIVTDFATGTGGDVIRLSGIGFSGLPSGANPFTTGYLRLVQVGANTELQGDQNGGGDGWKTILVLQNVTATNLTSSNFEPAYSPNGAGIILTGNENANSIAGTVDGDTILGLGGNDTIDGNAGNDSIDGGTGNDNLSGDLGNDTLLGGAGNDTLYGNAGDDSLSGGDGQDTLYGNDGDDTLLGGDGDDYLYDYEGANSLSGGAGADYFDYVGYSTSVDTLTGGAGSDTFNLYYPFSTGYVGDIVTDFAAGAGGDVIRLNDIGFSGLGSGVNPFTAGFLRLVQVGANTELQGDQNGGGDNWRTLLVLQNVTASSVTGANFSSGYSPTGSGATLTGNDTANNIEGSVDGDTILGLGGNDTIDGNAGNDSIDGGTGNDNLTGDLGNDTLLGGAGNDTLYGNAGDDSLSGGDGQDTLYGNDGDDTLLGGDGDDYLYDYEGANSLSGGAGADYFEYVGYNTGVDTLTGGAGSDTFSLYYPFDARYVADIVTDFATGTGGDVISLNYVNFSGLGSGVNPFTSGHLRLVQVGANTELQGDQNGGGDNWKTLLVLQNVTATSVTGANFSSGYSPTASGATLTGNDTANNIEGSVDGDTILGLGGNDTIDGNAGNDSIDGGTGNDNLTGDLGNDTLLGGAGNDTLYGNAGDDSLSGGDGQDRLEGNAGNDTLLGGDGDDYLGDYEGANSLSGGAGADYFDYVGYNTGVDTLTGGAGIDTFNLYYPFSTGYVADIVTDFATGTGGDVISLGTLGLSGLGSGVNPFTAGFLRLVQVGANTELQGDQNGGGDNWRTLLILQNTSAGSFTSANFSPSPTGSAGVSQTGGTNADTLTGTDGNDTLSGLGGNDTILGLGGNDNLDGGADNDSIAGGDGNDYATGGAGADAITGDAGNDTLYGNAGGDTIDGGIGNDTLYGNEDNDRLSGGEGQDSLYGGTGDDTLLGGDGDDYFDDTQGANSQSGGAGADLFAYIGYGTGIDTLTGGTGIDSFSLYFPTNASYVADVVTDFTTGRGGDVIRLDNVGFSGLGGRNPFTAGFMQLVQVGADTELRIDQDGGGNNYKTVLILQNTVATAFAAANFEPAYSPTGTGLTIDGSALSDNLAGDVDGDTINGFDGNDAISGNGGNDSIAGGGGNDTISGNVGNDTIDGGIGNDTLYGNEGDDSLSGGDGQDRLEGGAGNDTLLGGDGDDYFNDSQGANSQSGGAGADYFDYVGYGTSIDTLTGGAGTDTFNLYYPTTASYVADVVTDFTTGRGGDVVRLNDLGLSGLGDRNPFTAGFMRLVQVGADTELRIDQNGGGDNYKTVLILQNTVATAFTAANFEPAYSPTGTGLTIDGTALADNLIGSVDGDTISGFDGNDAISGNGGNDSIAGGGGNDTIYGNAGNDTIDGGSGNDTLYGNEGDDLLSGGDGQDRFTSEAGNDTFLGGDGDDYFTDAQGANSMNGGAGADYFDYVGNGNGVDTLTGGAGVDTFNLYYPVAQGYVADIVTDFTTGTGGDILRLDALGLSGLGDRNPFTTGYIALVQVGADTEVRVDTDGGGNSFKTVLILLNTTATSFTAANFLPAYSPTGAGQVITGTPQPDGLNGTPDGDTITGLDGSDTIDGGGGDDLIDAGTGADNVSGGAGNDTIDGGAGNDTLSGNAGNDVLTGGVGNDNLNGNEGDDSLSGGDGEDRFNTEAGNDTFLGGDGDDYFGDYQGANSVNGGAGADYFEYVGYGNGVDTLTGGAGVDTFNLFYPVGSGYVADIVTDFTAGAGGDILRLDNIGFSNLGDRNPFTAGFMQLVQVGADTELRVDTDGGGDSFKTVLILRGTTASSFTAANFDPAYSPTGTGVTITGTPLQDNLVGTPDGDTITGLEGNDTIAGNGGNDVIDGGAGNDTLYGNAGNDTVSGGIGNDTLYGNEGDDSLSGGEGQDRFTVEAGNDTFRGGDGDDYLGDYQGANVLDGGAGEDYFEYVSYSTGVDTLTGGAGVDTFNLYYPDSTSAADIVTDFTAGTGGDVVRLTGLGFSNLASGGNPFLTGHLRLFQSGADTLLQVDRDGGGDGYSTVLVLQNTNASAFTGVNFDPAYDPTGVGITFIGTPQADSFFGSPNADRAEGRDSNDTLDGNAGDDTMLGEGGNDYLYGDEGNDSLDGGIGNDYLLGGADNDVVIGGSGNDTLYGNAGNDTLSGGDGDDYLYDHEGANSLSGGAGADYFELVSYGNGVDTLTGGAGTDIYNINSSFSAGSVADIVTDFSTGIDGDIVRLSSLGLSGVPAGGNPFLTGHLRLVQVGADVQLQGDANGGGDAYQTLLVFQNTNKTAFAAANFDPPFDPSGVAVNTPPTAVADAVTVGEDGATTIAGATLLANDTDPDANDTKTIQSVPATSSAGASLSLVGGNVVYDLGSRFNGLGAGQTATDSFTYTMRDAAGATSSATVTVTITGANDAPTAVADAIAIGEDRGTIAGATLLANDTDPDGGDSKAIQSVSATSTQGATLSLVNGNVVYDPGTRFNGLRAGQTATDSFTYTMRDADGLTSSATVTVTINGANDAPVAVADAVAVDEDATTGNLVATLLGNDTDPDLGDSKTIVSVDTTGTLGTVTFDAASQRLTFTADDPSFDALDPGQTATTTFTYTMRDAGGLTSTATVTMTVNGVDNDARPNTPPTAVADAVTVGEDGATTIAGATLLANDTDPDANDTKAIQSVSATSTAGASVSLVNGNVVYDPGTRFNYLRASQTATDSFTYTMRDTAGATSTATVTVTITGANDAPTATADAVTVTEEGGTILAAALLGNDTDPDAGDTKTIQSVSATSAEGASVSLVNGDVVYDPGTRFNGLGVGQTATDSFTYTMRDALGLTSSATVTVTITGANDTPTANADSVTAAEDGATTIAGATLLANDTDADAGDTKTIQSVSGTSAQGASVSLVNGNVVYDPGTRFDSLSAGQTATDTFNYTMRDTAGATSTTTVTVTVIGANDTPIAVADNVTAAEDGTSTIAASTLLGNDIDPDAGDTRTIQSVSATSTQGANLSLVNGNVVYDPGARFNGLRAGQTATDTFTYTMRDAAGATSTATVTVTINGANDAPVAVGDAVAVDEDATTGNLVATLLGNDTDPDLGDSKTIVSVDTTGTLGTVAFDAASQRLTFTADDPSFDALNPGQTATTTFTYTMRDATGATSTATVTMTVNGVDNDARPNTPPTAVADAVTVGEDGATTIAAATLLANDTDPDAGDTKSIQSVSATSSQGASVSLVNGNVVYDPGTRFNGLRAGQTATDSFTYTMRDTAGATSSATVTVTITGANDAPVAVGDAAVVDEDATTGNLVAALLANDTDPDLGDSRTIVSVDTTGTRGTVAFDAATQMLTFTADDPSFDALAPGETTTTAFTYTIRDAAGATSTATVTMTVNGVDNDDDYIYGTNGNDVFEGGAGRDLYRGLAGNDVIRGNGGDDRIEAGDGNDVISGGTGNNLLFGQGGNDTFGNDLLVGTNLFDGGTGIDTLVTTASAGQSVTVNLLLGTVVGGTYDGSTVVSIENLRNGSSSTSVTYIGDDGANVLTGGAAADVLRGGGGADQLSGGAGADILDGGAGADVLSGGMGNDTFVLRAGQTNGDRILDFNGNGAGPGDTLVFEGFGADATLTNVGNVFTITYGAGLTETFTLNTALLHPSDYIFFG